MSHLECSQSNRTVETSSRHQDTEVQRREGICHTLVMGLRTQCRPPDSGASDVHVHTHTQALIRAGDGHVMCVSQSQGLAHCNIIPHSRTH